MTFPIAAGLILTLLALLSLPVCRLRRFATGLLYLSTSAALLALLALCGLLIFAPQFLPEETAGWLNPIATWLEEKLPALPAGAIWLVAAGAGVVLALPLLERLSFSRGLANYQAVVETLLHQIERSMRRLEKIAGHGETRNVSRIKSALETLRELKVARH